VSSPDSDTDNWFITTNYENLSLTYNGTQNHHTRNLVEHNRTLLLKRKKMVKRTTLHQLQQISLKGITSILWIQSRIMCWWWFKLMWKFGLLLTTFTVFMKSGALLTHGTYYKTCIIFMMIIPTILLAHTNTHTITHTAFIYNCIWNLKSATWFCILIHSSHHEQMKA
jgi:hypothetical protein